MTGIDVDISGNVGTITVSNPDRKNAIKPAFLPDIADALDELRDDVRCLVVTGDGDTFCSGFDLSELDDDTTIRTYEDTYEETMAKLAEFPYPTVAKVAGDAVGGGLDLCVSCDLRVATTDARFGAPTARIGIVYTDRVIRQLVHTLGSVRTKELLFTANLFDAEWANEAGFLVDVVDSDDLDDRTNELTSTIAGNAPLSLSASKQIIETILDHDRLSDTEQEFVRRLRDEAYESDDAAEGLAAISEGREPEFTGE
jgi:enoyl-CoA hydratase/carnithine racemase